MRTFLIFCFFAVSINLFAQNEPVVKSTLRFFNGTENRFISFGIDPSATDSIDMHLGESNLPPLPPLGVMEVRFNLPRNNFNGTLSSYNDYRFGTTPFSGQVEHRIRVQHGEGDTLTVYWALPSEITCELKDMSGTIINVQMSGEGSFDILEPDSYTQFRFFVNYNNATDIHTDEALIPEKTELVQNFPNPFNPTTIISFKLKEATNVRLKVFDITGKLIATLIDQYLIAGNHSIPFEAASLSTGVYFYQLKAKDYIQTKKMLLIR